MCRSRSNQRRNHIQKKARQVPLGKPSVKRWGKQQRLVDRVGNEVLAHGSNLNQNLLPTLSASSKIYARHAPRKCEIHGTEVCTQTTCDKEGFPIRDPDSTTYTGAIETAEEFGKRIYLEAWQRGWTGCGKTHDSRLTFSWE